MKKITKLLPVALALMLISPSFAVAATDGDHTQTSVYSFTVDPYLDIKKISETTTATVNTIDDKYANFALSAAMGSTFKVYTNKADQKLYLHATAGEDITEAEAPALYGTAAALKLIFANTSSGNGSVKATADDVKSVKTSPTASPNAFALALTPVFAPATDAPTTAAVTSSVLGASTGVVTYEMKNGIYDVSYTCGQSAVDSSFNTYDTHGIYKATLTLSNSET